MHKKIVQIKKMNTILFLSILIKLLLASLSLAESNDSTNDEDYAMIADNYYDIKENRGMNADDTDKKNKVLFNKSRVLDFIFPALFNNCAFSCKKPFSIDYYIFGLSF